MSPGIFLFHLWFSNRLILGMFLLFYSFKLFKNSTTQNAKVLMYVSILYLTLVQIVYLIDNLY
jgi:protoheme IX farnesyltransferase